MLKRMGVLAIVLLGIATIYNRMDIAGQAAKKAAPAKTADQWPSYQYDANFSPLTQITPANVSTLTKAWTFHYGGVTQNSGSLGLDYRLEVQPLIIGGIMYISTPGSPYDANVKST